ncbi:rho GTPase-activating protein gacF isoform X2 [Drosophila obscura]|uniref:rho GTPase-activating protein gacF isoform X2 n=1 Tax=Drosophila obscura TaxID=7282 RepID=UPI001BB1D960|nr:rho GTPase-activating protein gacF isoform X2 [Drosophila obscura]
MRINLRLDWRALALLGALLSCLIAWQGCLVFAMPMAITTISNQQINNTNNSHSNSTRFSNSNYLQSDHSRSKLVSVINQTTNQSINAEFNQSLTMQSTAIQTTTTEETTTIEERETETTSQSYDQQQDDDDQVEEPLGFVISAASPSEHLAVLSRTERSIRHQQKKHHHPQHHQHQQQQQQQQSPSADNNNFIGSKSKRLNNSRNNLNINSSNSNSNNNSPINNLDRNERSTVPQSHLAWTSRKIQLYIKNRILQLLPDGTVNGTQDEQSEYTILQRSTVDVGRIKLQSVATCLYLCMDACGAVYGSLFDLLQKDFTDDCVFNENMGLQNYNTYSSTYNSNARRVYYLALNRHGEPRRTQIPASRSLGKLTTYTNAITETVPQERVEQLIAKNFGANRIKHGVRQLCDTGKPLIELIDAVNFKKPPECSSSSGSSSSNGSGTSGTSSSASAAITTSCGGSSSLLCPGTGTGSAKQTATSSTTGRNSGIAVPVHAASAGSLISISNSSQSESGHISSSISTSTSNSTSNSSSNSSSSSHSSSLHPPPHLHPKQNKKKKRRMCKLHESEEQHNCPKRPAGGAGALRKRGPKAQRCKELRDKAAAEGGPPPNCGKKNGAKKNGGAAEASSSLPKAVHQRPRTVNGQPGGKKKPPKGGKQRPMVGKKQLQQTRGAALNGGKQRKQRPGTTTTMATSLATPSDTHWESSSPLPSMALSETSDRVERNVRMSSVEEEQDEDEGSLEDASYEDATSEAHARSGGGAAAGDDSLYYDFHCLLFLPLMFLRRSIL